MPNLGYSTMSMIPTMKGAEAAFQREVDQLLSKVKPTLDVRANTAPFVADAQSAITKMDGQSATVSVDGDAAPFVSETKQAGTDGGSFLAAGLSAAEASVALAAAGVGAAGAAAFVKATMAGIDADGLDRQLGARFGISDEQAAAAGNAAGSAYAHGFGETQADAADALTAARFNFAGVWDQEELQRISQQALGIADIFGGDVVEATRAAGNLVKNGLAKNSDEAFDLITKGYQDGADISGDFLDTINEYSVQWSKLGLTGADAIGGLVRGLQSGARDTDKLADAQKEFSIRAIDGSATTTQAYTDLGLSAWQMSQDLAAGGPAAKAAMSTVLGSLGKVQNKVDRDRIGVSLFGTQWEDIGAQVVAGLDPALGGLTDFEGATQEATDKAGGGLGNMIENWKRSAEVGLGNFAQEWITPGLERISGAFSEGGFSAAFDQALTEGGAIVDRIRGWLDTAIPAVQAWLQANGPAIAAKGQEILGWLVEKWVEGRTLLLDNLSVWLPALGEWVENVAVPFVEEHAGDWVSAFLAWAGPLAGQFLDAMGRFIAVVGAWFVTDFIPWAQVKSAEWGAALLVWFGTTAVPWINEKLGELQTAIGAWITDTAIPWLLEKGKELALAALQWIVDLPNLIAEKAPGAFDALVDAAKWAFTEIIKAWNGLSLEVTVPDWVPGIGGRSVDVLPDYPVPTFHQGGWVPGQGDVLALLEGGEYVATADQMAGGGLGGLTVHGGINITEATNARATAWETRHELRKLALLGLN